MTRTLLVSLFAGALLATSPAPAAAAPRDPFAEGAARRAEITPLFGVWLPIGSGRDDFDAAPLTGLQLAYDVDPHFAVVGTFSWAASSAKRVGDADLDVLQYDLGLRAQHAFALGRAASLRPFVGLGVGYSRFQFRDAQYADGPAFAFYSAAGAEVGYRALTAGLTLRHQTHSLDGSSLDVSAPRQTLGLFTSVGLRF